MGANKPVINGVTQCGISKAFVIRLVPRQTVLLWNIYTSTYFSLWMF